MTKPLIKKLTKPLTMPMSNTTVTDANHLVAIDLGSNSFHLIIAREQDGCLQILYRKKKIIGLAAGLDNNSDLSDEIIEKAISCLRDFNLSIVNLPSSAIRIVATHALRNAKNIDHFKDKAANVIPHPIEVISGKLEAELIYKGVAHTQPLRGATFILDIGGGSTELVIGHNFSTVLTDSLAMGCISVQQRFFLNGTINATAMRNAQAFAVNKLVGVADKYREFTRKKILGTSGSIKVISQAMLELYGDDKITKKRLKRLVNQLICWQHCDNIPLHSLEEARRPIFASAVAILSSCFTQLGIEQMKFSLGGLREGILYDLSQSRTDIDTRERTIHSLIKLYHVDQAFNQRVLQHIRLLNKQLKKASVLLNSTELTLLRWAAQLHEIGIAINFKKRQQHGAYIIDNSEMPGFSDDEKSIISLLVRCHRGHIERNNMGSGLENELTISSNVRIQLLIQLLRIAIILTQGRVQNFSTQVAIECLNQHGEDILQLNIANQTELIEKLKEEAQKQIKMGFKLHLVISS